MARTRANHLPPQLQKVLDFIKSEIAAGRKFPKQTAIRDHMGWKNVCPDATRSLALRGYITMRYADGPTKKYVFELAQPSARSAVEAPGAEDVNT